MRLSLEEFKSIVQMIHAEKIKPAVIEVPLVGKESITISTEASEDGLLDVPISIEGEIIKTLGVYNIKGYKIWIVKK